MQHLNSGGGGSVHPAQSWPDMRHPALDKQVFKIDGRPVTVHTNFDTDQVHIYSPGISIKTTFDAYIEYAGDFKQFITEEIRDHDNKG